MAERPVLQQARYLVELSVPEAGWRDVGLLIRRARESNRTGQNARFVRAIFVPEDASCFLLYEAGSAQAAAAAASGVESAITRVSEVVQAGGGAGERAE